MDRLVAMEAFVKVVESGSFSAAARQLNIGQPAVSKAVAQLEDWLGVRLLLRSTRSLTPTEAGQNFYDRAKRSIEEAEEAVASARGAAAGLSGRLRVSASVCFARIHVMPRLPAFLADNPDLDIELMLDDRNIDLVEEGIDVALRMGVPADSALTGRKIGQARRVVVASPAYLARTGEPTSPAALLSHEAVVYTRDGGGSAWTFRQGTAETSVNLKGRVRTNSAEGLREAVFGHLGLAIASEWVFSPELTSGLVKPMLLDWALPQQDLWAVFPTGRLVSTKARAFALFVETCMSDNQLAMAA